MCNITSITIYVATNTNMTVFWDVALCSLVEINRRFRDAYCLHHQGDEASFLLCARIINSYFFNEIFIWVEFVYKYKLL
jgi:hypothetical protein